MLDEITSDHISVTSLTGGTGFFDTVSIGTLHIQDLTMDDLTVNSITGGDANFNNLKATNITGTNGYFTNLVADNITFDDVSVNDFKVTNFTGTNAWISQAQITNLSVTNFTGINIKTNITKNTVVFNNSSGILASIPTGGNNTISPEQQSIIQQIPENNKSSFKQL